MRLDVDNLTIGCPCAKERKEITLNPGDGFDVVVEGTANLVIDSARLLKLVGVPIVVVGPHLSESRRIPLEVGG